MDFSTSETLEFSICDCPPNGVYLSLDHRQGWESDGMWVGNYTDPRVGLGFKFGTKQYLPLKDAKLEELRKTFQELEVVVMDEFSMIGSDRLYDVDRRMEEIFITKDILGGKAVMLVGDIMQLPPVKARPIYSKPMSKKNRSKFESSENIWRSFDIVTLKTNFRQGVCQWTECLNRLRVGEITDDDRQLLETRRLSNFPEFHASFDLK